MTSHLFVVFVGKIGDGVGTSERKVVTLRLGRLPLHGVFWGDRIEVDSRLDDALFDGVITNSQCCADVLATFGGPSLSKALILGRGRCAVVGWSGSTQAKQGKSYGDCGEVHAVLLQTTLECLQIGFD